VDQHDQVLMSARRLRCNLHGTQLKVYGRWGISYHRLANGAEFNEFAGQRTQVGAFESAAIAPQQPLNPRIWTLYHDSLARLIEQGYPMLPAGDSDGVVPVSSARHPGVQTETLRAAIESAANEGSAGKSPAFNAKIKRQAHAEAELKQHGTSKAGRHDTHCGYPSSRQACWS
jgi:hypothetical protein